MQNSSIRNLALLVLGLAVIAAGLYFYFNRNYVYKGSSYAPFPGAVNFRLTDQHGNPFELAVRRGKVILLFFGYTNCPDVCPTTLADFGRIKAGLGERSENVLFVFITEDPERDNQARLAEYLSAFDPAIIGLTGSLEELQPVWVAYYIAREKEQVTDHEDEYMVAHTSRIYVIDKLGRLRLTFAYDMTVEDMTQDVLHLVDELPQDQPKE